MTKFDWGIFCDVYGRTMNNLVLEYFLENEDLDVAISGMIEQTGISKPKAYSIVKELEKKGYIIKSRIIGKTQLYALDKRNKIVKIFLRNFNECLNMIIEKYTENKHIKGTGKRSALSTHNI